MNIRKSIEELKLETNRIAQLNTSFTQNEFQNKIENIKSKYVSTDNWFSNQLIQCPEFFDCFSMLIRTLIENINNVSVDILISLSNLLKEFNVKTNHRFFQKIIEFFMKFIKKQIIQNEFNDNNNHIFEWIYQCFPINHSNQNNIEVNDCNSFFVSTNQGEYLEMDLSTFTKSPSDVIHNISMITSFQTDFDNLPDNCHLISSFNVSENTSFKLSIHNNQLLLDVLENNKIITPLQDKNAFKIDKGQYPENHNQSLIEMNRKNSGDVNHFHQSGLSHISSPFIQSKMIEITNMKDSNVPNKKNSIVLFSSLSSITSKSAPTIFSIIIQIYPTKFELTITINNYKTQTSHLINPSKNTFHKMLLFENMTLLLSTIYVCNKNVSFNQIQQLILQKCIPLTNHQSLTSLKSICDCQQFYLLTALSDYKFKSNIYKFKDTYIHNNISLIGYMVKMVNNNIINQSLIHQFSLVLCLTQYKSESLKLLLSLMNNSLNCLLKNTYNNADNGVLKEWETIKLILPVIYGFDIGLNNIDLIIQLIENSEFKNRTDFLNFGILNWTSIVCLFNQKSIGLFFTKLTLSFDKDNHLCKSFDFDNIQLTILQLFLSKDEFKWIKISYVSKLGLFVLHKLITPLKVSKFNVIHLLNHPNIPIHEFSFNLFQFILSLLNHSVFKISNINPNLSNPVNPSLKSTINMIHNNPSLKSLLNMNQNNQFSTHSPLIKSPMSLEYRMNDEISTEFINYGLIKLLITVDEMYLIENILKVLHNLNVNRLEIVIFAWRYKHLRVKSLMNLTECYQHIKPAHDNSEHLMNFIDLYCFDKETEHMGPVDVPLLVNPKSTILLLELSLGLSSDYFRKIIMSLNLSLNMNSDDFLKKINTVQFFIWMFTSIIRSKLSESERPTYTLLIKLLTSFVIKSIHNSVYFFYPFLLNLSQLYKSHYLVCNDVLNHVFIGLSQQKTILLKQGHFNLLLSILVIFIDKFQQYSSSDTPHSIDPNVKDCQSSSFPFTLSNLDSSNAIPDTIQSDVDHFNNNHININDTLNNHLNFVNPIIQDIQNNQNTSQNDNNNIIINISENNIHTTNIHKITNNKDIETNLNKNQSDYNSIENSITENDSHTIDIIQIENDNGSMKVNMIENDNNITNINKIENEGNNNIEIDKPDNNKDNMMSPDKIRNELKTDENRTENGSRARLNNLSYIPSMILFLTRYITSDQLNTVSELSQPFNVSTDNNTFHKFISKFAFKSSDNSVSLGINVLEILIYKLIENFNNLKIQIQSFLEEVFKTILLEKNSTKINDFSIFETFLLNVIIKSHSVNEFNGFKYYGITVLQSREGIVKKIIEHWKDNKIDKIIINKQQIIQNNSSNTKQITINNTLNAFHLPNTSHQINKTNDNNNRIEYKTIENEKDLRSILLENNKGNISILMSLLERCSKKWTYKSNEKKIMNEIQQMIIQSPDIPVIDGDFEELISKCQSNYEHKTDYSRLDHLNYLEIIKTEMMFEGYSLEHSRSKLIKKQFQFSQWMFPRQLEKHIYKTSLNNQNEFNGEITNKLKYKHLDVENYELQRPFIKISFNPKFKLYSPSPFILSHIHLLSNKLTPDKLTSSPPILADDKQSLDDPTTDKLRPDNPLLADINVSSNEQTRDKSIPDVPISADHEKSLSKPIKDKLASNSPLLNDSKALSKNQINGKMVLSLPLSFDSYLKSKGINYFKVFRIEKYTFVGGYLYINDNNKTLNFLICPSILMKRKHPVELIEYTHQYNKKLTHSWSVYSISNLFEYRFLLKRQSIQVILNNKKTLLFHFIKKPEMSSFIRLLMQFVDKTTTDLVQDFNLNKYQQKWECSKISTFKYLMLVNKHSSRCVYDYSQYPVFPMLVKSIESEELELRNLETPIGMDGDIKRKQSFVNRYNQSGSFNKGLNYYYGSHYSSPAIVLSFLIRLRPYHKGCLSIQNGVFDLPDRLFYNFSSTIKNIMSDISDVRELIPELYYLPSILMNFNNFDFGKNQSNQRVNNVIIPDLFMNSPFRMIYGLRRLLEMKKISMSLDKWIDLIFGYKQNGEKAKKAQNVYYHLTYEQFHKNTNEPNTDAIDNQIYHFGQIPVQLFNSKHSSKHPYEFLKNLINDRSNCSFGIIKNTMNNVKEDKIYFIKILKDESEDDLIVNVKFNETVIFRYSQLTTFDNQSKQHIIKFESSHSIASIKNQLLFDFPEHNSHKIIEVFSGIKLLFGGLKTGKIIMFDLKSQKKLFEYSHHNTSVIKLISVGKHRLISVDKSSIICVSTVDISNNAIIPECICHEYHNSEIRNISICSTDNYFYTIFTNKGLFEVKNIINPQRTLFSISYSNVFKGRKHSLIRSVYDHCEISFGYIPCLVLSSYHNGVCEVVTYSFDSRVIAKYTMKEKFAKFIKLHVLKNELFVDYLLAVSENGENYMFDLPMLDRAHKVVPSDHFKIKRNVVLAKNRMLWMTNDGGVVSVFGP